MKIKIIVTIIILSIGIINSSEKKKNLDFFIAKRKKEEERKPTKHYPRKNSSTVQKITFQKPDKLLLGDEKDGAIKVQNLYITDVDDEIKINKDDQEEVLKLYSDEK